MKLNKEPEKSNDKKISFYYWVNSIYWTFCNSIFYQTPN